MHRSASWWPYRYPPLFPRYLCSVFHCFSPIAFLYCLSYGYLFSYHLPKYLWYSLLMFNSVRPFVMLLGIVVSVLTDNFFSIGTFWYSHVVKGHFWWFVMQTADFCYHYLRGIFGLLVLYFAYVLFIFCLPILIGVIPSIAPQSFTSYSDSSFFLHFSLNVLYPHTFLQCVSTWHLASSYCGLVFSSLTNQVWSVICRSFSGWTFSSWDIVTLVLQSDVRDLLVPVLASPQRLPTPISYMITKNC